MRRFFEKCKKLARGAYEVLLGLVGMRDGSRYGMVLRRVVSTMFAAVVVMWGVMWVVRFSRSVYRNVVELFAPEERVGYYPPRYLNEGVYYVESRWGNYGYVCDGSGKRLVEQVACVGMPMEGDSLVYFSDGERRGYFHLRDGHLVVSPRYEHAWVCSDGLAAVERGGQIVFVDTSGRVVIDRGFAYERNWDGYVFHKGHCAVYEPTGRYMGMIDGEGNWAVEPVFDTISPVDSVWYFVKGDRRMVLSFDMDTLLPMAEAMYEIGRGGISATFADHTQNRYTLDGKLVSENEIQSIEQLFYHTDEVYYHVVRHEVFGSEEPVAVDSVVDTRMAVARCSMYQAATGWYGLLSSEGRRLTPPCYLGIEAIGYDLYLCEAGEGRKVVLDGRGQEVR